MLDVLAGVLIASLAGVIDGVKTTVVSDVVVGLLADDSANVLEFPMPASLGEASMLCC